jgi:antitoxin component YwqK of YwqJK toxin-antitoxin module
VYANILPDENKIRVDDDKYYYWFSANDIKTSRGGYDGKLLHGVYTEFYSNKNLKQKGEFKYGLKIGEWKSWNMAGEYEEIVNWKKGRKYGRFRMFNANGKVVKEGRYKDDILNGRIRAYMNDGTIESIYYKDGSPMLEKKGKIKKIFKKSGIPKEKKINKKELKKDTPENKPSKDKSKNKERAL